MNIPLVQSIYSDTKDIKIESPTNNYKENFKIREDLAKEDLKYKLNLTETSIARHEKLKGEEEIYNTLKESGRRLNHFTNTITSLLEFDERSNFDEQYLLNNFLKQGEELIEKLGRYISVPANYHLEFDRNIDIVKREMQEIENQDINKATFHNYETKKNSALEYIKKVNEERKKLGEKINPKLLAQTKIKNIEDPKNQVFSWILKIFYGEHNSAYYWKNFKKEVFKRDKGEDFKKRLQELNLFSLSSVDDQVTESLIQNQPEILKQKMSSAQKENLQNLFAVALKVKETCQGCERLKEIEKENKKALLEVEDRENKLIFCESKINFLNHQRTMIGRFHGIVLDFELILKRMGEGFIRTNQMNEDFSKKIRNSASKLKLELSNYDMLVDSPSSSRRFYESANGGSSFFSPQPNNKEEIQNTNDGQCKCTIF